MEENEITARFFKHRRNMFLLSGVFIFLCLSGGSIEYINILGSKLTFSNPEVPLDTIMLCMIYMLIKYLQYLSDMGGTGLITKIRHLVRQKLPMIAKSHDEMKIGEKVNIRAIDYNDFQLIGSFSYRVRLDPAVRQSLGKSSKSPHKETLIADRIFGIRDLWKVYALALFHVLFRTVWVTEYFVPIVLALAGFILYFFPDLGPQIIKSSP